MIFENILYLKISLTDVTNSRIFKFGTKSHITSNRHNILIIMFPINKIIKKSSYKVKRTNLTATNLI